MANHPIELFKKWYAETENAHEPMPEAMTLATAGRDGRPSARMVLLKSVSPAGFTFFTNYESRKGEEIAENPWAALVFHWKALERQVRIEGQLKKVSRKESQAYFDSRPRGSRISAWASPQSTAIPDRLTLESRVAEIERRFQGKDKIPCPPYWGGFLLVPERMEFWQGQPSRLHDRKVFYRANSKASWKSVFLAP